MGVEEITQEGNYASIVTGRGLGKAFTMCWN